MKTLIADDDQQSREGLTALLNRSKRVTRVYEAESVEAAYNLVQQYSPDVLFLNLRMPGKNGLHFLHLFCGKSNDTVFIADREDDEAVGMMRSRSLDYICRPYTAADVNRVLDIIERRREELRQASSQGETLRSQSLVQAENQKRNYMIPCSYGYKLVDISDIVFVEANNTKTIVHLNGNQKIISTNRLKNFESQLGAQFYRVHKSYLVNLAHVTEYTNKNGNYVILNHQVKVDVSRMKVKGLQDVLRQESLN